MQTSASIQNLAKALIVFHQKVEKIRKDANNPFFKSRYASLSNILEAINSPLIESGLTFSQFPTGENGLTTILMHADSGEFIQSDYIMRPVKEDPQGRGSAITYMRRYALAAVLGLNIDEDDDGNKASQQEKKTESKNGVVAFAEITTGVDLNPKAALPWMNKDTVEYKGAIAKLIAGQTTMEKIQQHFKLSKVVKTELEKHIKQTA